MKTRYVVLITLWVLLAWRVSTLVFTESSETQSFLLQLALFAWLGGLVTSELIRPLIARYRS